MLLKHLSAIRPAFRSVAFTRVYRRVAVRSLLPARTSPALLVAMGLLSLMAVNSCRSLKKSTPPAASTTRQDTSIANADTSRSELETQFDSLTNKVGSFLRSLLPPGEDTGKAVLTPPRDDSRNPMVGKDERAEGFLRDPVERTIEFDSNGNVIERDVFLGGDVGQPSMMTFEEYLRQQKQRSAQEAFKRNALGYQPGDTSSAQQQAGWFDDYTQVNIPIPPSIVPGIFGKPQINLRVSGDVAVHLAYRDNQFLATTGALFSGSETGLDFKQEINVSTKGTIGDKLNIGADWGSDRSFQFENLLKLGYKGYPEELLQSVEAGNVNLTTPSQYIGTQQALFGLKAVARFGPAYVTALAAQKKGDRQTKTFGGGAAGTATEIAIQPASYRRNSYFLDTSFIPNYEPYYSTLTAGEGNLPPGSPRLQSDNKQDVEVWRLTTNTADVKRRTAVAWYYLPPIASINARYDQAYHAQGQGQSADTIQRGDWIKLDTNQYTFNRYTGVLSLAQEPSNDQAIAVRYATEDGRNYGETHLAEGELILKLIKPVRSYFNPSAPAWRNMLKNTYYLGASNFDLKDFELRIVSTKPSGEQIEIIRHADGIRKVISALGLDRVNNSNPSDITPDGLIDMSTDEKYSGIVDRRSGTLFFPYLEPFGSRIVTYFAEQGARNSRVKFDITFYFPDIYTEQYELIKNNKTPNAPKNNKISIRSKVSGGVSTTMNLGAFNIVDGSVKVSIGGSPLKENIDYRVDYNSGTVTMLRPDLTATGQVSIDYETHDIFTTSTKSVLGFRTEVPVLDKGLFGFSLMNYNMTLPSLKTRQGEEPLSNWIMGFDAGYNVDAPFITDFLNYMPWFNLREKSTLALRTDFALSLPNPNTQESPMPVDEGASIAYVDDFEGGKQDFPLYSSYGRWHPASQPTGESYLPSIAVGRGQAINALKGKTWWYERIPADVDIKTIKPNRSTQRAAETAQVLDVIFDPRRPGIYNPVPNQDLNAFPNETRWGGLMQYAPGLNVPATNTDAIEFWMKIEANGKNTNGRMRINIGQISEDVIPNGILNTEDRNLNGRYDPDEDVGLDNWDDPTERDSLVNADDLEDPDRDNYSFTLNEQNYERLNGHQGNQQDGSNGLKPDTEDLDANTTVNLDDAYYEYEIPLDPFNNSYVIGRSSADPNWVQYRIPLSDYKRLVGTQDVNFTNVSYYRLWFTGFDDLVHIRLHELGLVGSQWTRGSRGLSTTNPVADSSLKLSYVNIEENAAAPTNYKEPPGAQRDRLAGQTDFVLGNEQSLAMKVNCLPSSEGREAVRVFPAPNDIFNYRSLAIYLHGDDTRPETLRDTINQVWAYVRFGTDADNYYEYRRPVQRDWQNIHIDFERLTSLKASKAANSESASEAANDGIPGSQYFVKGSPTLTSAPLFTLGIENHTGDNCLTTELWWDEMRLLNANDKVDYAVNASTQLKLAEFGRVTASIVNERPDFHRVDERFNANRTLNFNWNITGEFSMNKLLPKSMENVSTFPLTLSHSEVILRPKYQPNTDVEIESALAKIEARRLSGEIDDREAQRLTEEARLSNETVVIKNSIGMTGVKFTFPGSFFLIPSFLNRLTYGFGYGEEFSRSPQYEYNRAWSWTGTLRYELPTLPRVQFDPLTWVGNTTVVLGAYSGWKLNFLPNRVTFGVSTTRGRTHSLNRLSTLQFLPGSDGIDSMDVLRGRIPQINRVFTATRGMEFNWKLSEGGLLSPSFDYGLDVTSNLAPLETERVPRGPDAIADTLFYRQRSVSAILDDIFLKDGNLVNPGRDFASSQKVVLNTSPRLPTLFGLEKLVRPLFSYRVDYRWLDAQTDVQNAKFASWTNNITTGLEFNVRELGIMIFGKPVDDEPAQRGGTRPSPTNDPRLSRMPSELRDPEEVRDLGYDERNTPPPDSRDEPRNQVERGEDFRPQRRRHPIESGPQLLDTLNRGGQRGGVRAQDTTGRVRIPGLGAGGKRTTEYSVDTTLTPRKPLAPREPEIVEVEDPYTVKEALQDFVQKPLFDWNGTRFNFTQSNSSQNPAVMGSGPGISNFLVKGIFVPEDDRNGPSRAYQLGLISDPHGRLLFRWKPQFPFIEFDVRHGDRSPTDHGSGMDIIDVFNQQNNFELTTSRPLWDGANLSLNWKLQFSYDRRNTLRLTREGIDELVYFSKSGDVSRTFLSIPELPFLGIKFSGIQRVGELYLDKMNAVGARTQSERDSVEIGLRNRIQREAFMEGFESLPFFSGFLREFLPRLNYSFNWTGMEKFFLFSFADRVSFRHGYNGNYRRNFRQNQEDVAQFSTLQTVVYGFRPLIALDMDWNEVWNGKLRGSVNYDTQTDWGSDYSSQRITRRLSTTIGVTANFSRQGLSIPWLGLDLKNEFGATFSFTKTISNDSYYTFEDIGTNPEGTGNGGLTKTTIEPRVSYTISQQLSLEGFYRYERTEPAATGQLSPPTRLILAGIDVRLKIQ